MRQGVIFAIKGSFRSICNHPFLVGFLCLLVFMYRSSPFMFSLLVSASPVFVCSAVLLGTLLSFGQENLPETEIEEKKCHEPVFVKKGEEILKEAVVVDQDGSYYVAKLREETMNDAGLGEGSSKEPSFLVVKKIGEICRENDLDKIPIVSGDEQGDKKWEESDVVLSDESIEGTWEEANRELFENSSECNEKGLSSDGEVTEGNQYTSIPKANGETTRLDDEKIGEGEHVEEDDDDDDDDEGMDSGSVSESLSPEASMAEVMPMLDELHPLLVEDGPQAMQTPHEGSSSDDDETEAEDDTNNGYNKVGKKKSAITWTEEDQRNLMDLGSSEIERNQRLENLLMRRKAKKNMSMGPQMSLIDFDLTDNVASSFNLPPPIITMRQNPFDDVYDNAPIPGSAPSILLPTHNPFDIPYSTSQEKLAPPPIMEDHRVETSSQSREQPFFSRHESFSVGPSLFVQNRQDVHFRPFFMPEAFGTSSYSMFHRIPSEVSESKASSVLTESLGSVEDLEDHKLLQEVNHINNIFNIHPQEVSRMEEHEVIEKCESGDQERVSKDVSQELELISKIGHGSHSSGDDDDRHEFDVNLKFQSRDVENPHEEGDLALYSCSSSSSLSEAGETIFTKTDVEKPKIKTQTSMESTTPSIAGNTMVDDVHHKEPVYDRSPTSHVEKPDLVLPPIVVKRTVSFVERTIEIKDYEREENYVPSSDSDADVFYEVNERLASTPFAAGGTPTVFYDVMHDHSFELLREVQVPNTPVEAFERPKTIQNLNISEVHELEHDMSPNFNSSITPDFISMPSSIVSEEEGSSHADVQTISEQANKIREIDGLLSELDRSGDSGLTRWESCSNVLEKTLDAKDTISEMPELEATTVKDIDAVYKKFKNEENELGKNTDKKANANKLSEMPELEARTVKDIDAVYKKLSNNAVEKTDTVSEMPEFEARTVKDIDAVYKKLSNNTVQKADTVSEMPKLEARSVKDIDAVYKKLNNNAVDKTDTVFEMPEFEARTVKDIDAVYKKLSNNVAEKTDTVSEMPELEARTVKDIDAVYKKLSNNAVEKVDMISEMPEFEARTVKDIDAVYKKLSDNTVEKTNTVSEMPELEARTVKDIDAVYKKLSDKKNELQNTKNTVSEMPELEAKSFKDIDEVYKKFSDKETENPVVPSEGTSSVKLLNGKSDNEVKLNTDKGSSVEIKAEKELDSSVDKNSLTSAEKPQDVNSTASGTGWFGASRLRFFG